MQTFKRLINKLHKNLQIKTILVIMKNVSSYFLLFNLSYFISITLILTFKI